MKKKLILSFAIVLMMLCVGEVATAQTKSEIRKKERAAKNAEEMKDFVELIQTEKFKFSVFSIDSSPYPGLSTYQLKNGYFVYILNKELTVLLPLLGPNLANGNAAGVLRETSFTTFNYKISLSPGQEEGVMIASINTTDPSSKNTYNLEIKFENGRTILSTFTSGLQKIDYRGSLKAFGDTDPKE